MSQQVTSKMKIYWKRLYFGSTHSHWSHTFKLYVLFMQFVYGNINVCGHSGAWFPGPSCLCSTRYTLDFYHGSRRSAQQLEAPELFPIATRGTYSPLLYPWCQHSFCELASRFRPAHFRLSSGLLWLGAEQDSYDSVYEVQNSASHLRRHRYWCTPIFLDWSNLSFIDIQESEKQWGANRTYKYASMLAVLVSSSPLTSKGAQSSISYIAIDANTSVAGRTGFPAN
jgi:hypothetical protein